MASIPAPRGGFSTPFTFHPAVCVCINLLACTSEGPHPVCRQLSCPEPTVGSAPAVCRASLQRSWGGKPEQEGSAYPGHTSPCRATGKTLLGWLWAVPTCHHGWVPRPPAQPCPWPGSVPTEHGQLEAASSKTPRSWHRSQQGLPLGHTDCCQLERTKSSIYMGNAGFSVCRQSKREY